MTQPDLIAAARDLYRAGQKAQPRDERAGGEPLID
jgi:hypothetical protein